MNSVIFYLPLTAATYDMFGPQHTPWVDSNRINREGIAVVIRKNNKEEMDALQRLLQEFKGEKHLFEEEVSRTFLGFSGKSETYLIAIILPQHLSNQ